MNNALNVVSPKGLTVLKHNIKELRDRGAIYKTNQGAANATIIKELQSKLQRSLKSLIKSSAELVKKTFDKIKSSTPRFVVEKLELKTGILHIINPLDSAIFLEPDRRVETNEEDKRLMEFPVPNALWNMKRLQILQSALEKQKTTEVKRTWNALPARALFYGGKMIHICHYIPKNITMKQKYHQHPKEDRYPNERPNSEYAFATREELKITSVINKWVICDFRGRTAILRLEDWQHYSAFYLYQALGKLWPSMKVQGPRNDRIVTMMKTKYGENKVIAFPTGNEDESRQIVKTTFNEIRLVHRKFESAIGFHETLSGGLYNTGEMVHNLMKPSIDVLLHHVSRAPTRAKLSKKIDVASKWKIGTNKPKDVVDLHWNIASLHLPTWCGVLAEKDSGKTSSTGIIESLEIDHYYCKSLMRIEKEIEVLKNAELRNDLGTKLNYRGKASVERWKKQIISKGPMSILDILACLKCMQALSERLLDEVPPVEKLQELNGEDPDLDEAQLLDRLGIGQDTAGLSERDTLIHHDNHEDEEVQRQERNRVKMKHSVARIVTHAMARKQDTVVMLAILLARLLGKTVRGGNRHDPATTMMVFRFHLNTELWSKGDRRHLTLGETARTNEEDWELRKPRNLQDAPGRNSGNERTCQRTAERERTAVQTWMRENHMRELVGQFLGFLYTYDADCPLFAVCSHGLHRMLFEENGSLSQRGARSRVDSVLPWHEMQAGLEPVLSAANLTLTNLLDERVGNEWRTLRRWFNYENFLPVSGHTNEESLARARAEAKDALAVSTTLAARREFTRHKRKNLQIHVQDVIWSAWQEPYMDIVRRNHHRMMDLLNQHLARGLPHHVPGLLPIRHARAATEDITATDRDEEDLHD